MQSVPTLCERKKPYHCKQDTKKIEYGLISWCNTCYQQQENANKNINFHAYLLFQ